MNQTSDRLIVGFGDAIDRIVCTPVGTAPVLRKGRSGPSKSVYDWMKVYDETRQRFGRPLTLLAAEKLKDVVREGNAVFIATNSLETDGPPGASALARALAIGLDAIPIILTNLGFTNEKEDPKYEHCMPQTCIGAGLIPVTNPKDLMEGVSSRKTVLIRKWPARSVKGAIDLSNEILDEFEPKAIVTVEATDLNKKGVRHGALGDPQNPKGDPQEEVVRWNHLLDAARERGILTIACGDNGNECGFGVIEDILMKYHRFCADCGCPCGGGIVSASSADIVVPAHTSNWACYGIEACLARLLEDADLMHDEYTENRILLNCANLGIPDGATEMCTPTTDGSSHETGIYIVGLLRHTVAMSFKELVRGSRSSWLARGSHL